MKPILFLTALFFLATLIPSLPPQMAYAIAPSSVKIESIDHVVEPIYGGLLMINDTFRISSTIENTTVNIFSTGFPQKYKEKIRFSMAFSAEEPTELLNLVSDTGLGVIGFYGVTVFFPPEVQSLLQDGHSYTFTVTYILSDVFDSRKETVNATAKYIYTSDLPLYPSITQVVPTCNVTLLLPENTEFESSDIPFNITETDTRKYLHHEKEFLPEYSEISAKVTFSTEAERYFSCFSVRRLYREITADLDGGAFYSDTYLLTSQTAFKLSYLRFQLPSGREGVEAFDEQGADLTVATITGSSDYEVTVSLEVNQSRSIKVAYHLRSEVVQDGSDNQVLSVNLFDNLRLIPETFIVKIVFPEGSVVDSFPEQRFSLDRDIFQETLSLELFNSNWLQEEEWSFTYHYPIFWSSFRPTLWVTALVIVGSVIAFAWRRPRAPTPVSVILVPRKTLSQFVELYEDKKRIMSDLESAKQKARKGKVSRRRYKVRKTTLDNQLTALSKRLVDLRQKIASAGTRYAEVMRSLEVAEIELENIDADVRRIEIRFKRGDISAETYRRLLEDDLRRQEKARTTIDGILLRLRE